MNWDTQLDSILHATDSSVVKIKQRLSTAEALSKVPELPLDSLSDRKSVYDMPAGTLQLCPLYTRSSSQGISAEETATISSQLDTQARKMEFMTQTVRRLEREQQQQQQHILDLEEEIRRLRNVPRILSDPALESRMEELRQEVLRELRSLREQVLLPHGRSSSLEQAPSTYLQQEVAESKQMLWQECRGLGQEIRQIKQDLRRQEKNHLQQIADSQEVKTLQDKTCKTLEEVVSSHKSHSMDLERTKLDGEQRDQELQALRAAITSIKEEMNILNQDSKWSPHNPWHRTYKGHDPQRKQSCEVLSASEESVSHLSLTDISSEEDGLNSAAHTSRSLGSMVPPAVSDSIDDLSSDLEGLSDSLPEFSSSDL